jgi:hypothetical protein
MPKKNKKDLANVIGQFVRQYSRKAPRGGEPNDRKIEQHIRRMRPEELDEVLNGEGDDRIAKI